MTTISSCAGQKSVKGYNIDETSRKAADRLGGNQSAAYAVLKAYDNGFSPSQISRAIYNNGLAVKGTIKGVEPKREKQGSLKAGLLPSHGSLAQVAGPPMILARSNEIGNRADFEGLFNGLNDNDSSRWLVWILGSTAAGYSVDQVLDYAERRISEQNEPEELFGVPIVMSEDGELPKPKFDTDWPFEGRQAISGLILDDALSAYDMMEVLAIGLYNAGYSKLQIADAMRKNSVCLATTKKGENGIAVLIPGFIKDGKLVEPERATKMRPESILINDISPDWSKRIDVGAAEERDRAVKKRDGEMSFKLVPSFANTDRDEYQDITKHKITLTLKRNKSEVTKDTDATYYEVYANVMIGVTATKDDPRVNNRPGRFKKGDRWIIEGEIFPLTDDNNFSLQNLLSGTDRRLGKSNAIGVFDEKHITDGGESKETFTRYISGKFNEDFTKLDFGIIAEETGRGIYGLKVGK